MPSAYYTLPLRLDLITARKPHPVCGLKESIAQNIYLILTTHFAESRYDDSYGSFIWEQDFEVQAGIKWKEQIRASLEESLRKHEKRLSQLKVRVDIDEYEFVGKMNRRVKQRLGVRIEGTILKTNEKLDFFETIYISPLSAD